MTNTNNIMIPRFIKLIEVHEDFEARYNTMYIIAYGESNGGKNSFVHLYKGSSTQTLIVKESVQDITKLIGDE